MTPENLARARAWIAPVGTLLESFCDQAISWDEFERGLAEILAAAVQAAVEGDRARVAALFDERYGTFHDIGTAEVSAFLHVRNVHDAADVPEVP